MKTLDRRCLELIAQEFGASKDQVSKVDTIILTNWIFVQVRKLREEVEERNDKETVLY